jgi:DNA-binding phage protein
MNSSTQEAAVFSAAGTLDQALEGHDIKRFLALLSQTIRAQGGFTAAAAATRINRTALYKMLSPDGNPTAGTLSSLLRHLGLRLSIQPLAPGNTRSTGTFGKDMH